MAIVGELVNFLYGVNGTPSTKAGYISFDSGKKAIYVGDGTTANLVTSHVKDAKFESNKLTIEFVDASANIELDFTDVASTKGVMAVFESLDSKIETLSTNVNESIKALENAYKLADSSIRTDFEAADTAINNKIGTVAEGKTVVGLIEEAKAAANAAHSVVAKDSSFLTLNTSTGENGAIIYTLGTSDIASASALAEVKATAEAAQTAEEVSTAISNAIDALAGSAEGADDSSFVKVAVTSENGEVKSVTVTTTGIAKASDLNDVSTRLDSFLNGEGVADTVDTLKDIQAWINGEGVNATELTQAIANEAELRALADGSIRTDFAAADTALSNRIKAVEDDYLKASDKTELSNTINGVSAVANAAAVKTTTDASLALKADASNVYAKSETYTKTEVDGLVNGAKANASTAESNAKAYADAIKVNGKSQSGQNITVSGLDILVGGSGYGNDSSISEVINTLDTRITEVAGTAGVKEVKVDAEDANYAAVSTANNVVTFNIKTQDVSTATESGTGLADAYETKQYVSFRIDGVVGSASDASNVNTVYGAKAHATALNTAMDERVTTVENQLKWQQLN